MKKPAKKPTSKKTPPAKKMVVTPTGRLNPPGPEMQTINPKTPEAKLLKEAIAPTKPPVKRGTNPNAPLKPGDVFEFQALDDIAAHFLFRASKSGHDAAVVWREAAGIMQRCRYYVPTLLPNGEHAEKEPLAPPRAIEPKEIVAGSPTPAPTPKPWVPPKPQAPKEERPKRNLNASDEEKRNAKRERARLRRMKRRGKKG